MLLAGFTVHNLLDADKQGDALSNMRVKERRYKCAKAYMLKAKDRDNQRASAKVFTGEIKTMKRRTTKNLSVGCIFLVIFFSAFALLPRPVQAQAVTTITVGSGPFGVAVTPNGAYAYVTNGGGNTVSVIRDGYEHGDSDNNRWKQNLTVWL